MNLSSYLPAMPYAVRELFDKAANIVMNYTDTEAKVVEATNDESWGPAGKLLQELSQLSNSSEHYSELMGMLWKRCFTQDKRYWRRTYKSLLVLTYLIKNGSEKVSRSAREHLYDLKNLESFSYHDEQGKDQGINIRHKVKELIELIQDENRIREERKKAKANKDKYIGMSNEASSYRCNDQWNHIDEYSSKDKSNDNNQNFTLVTKKQDKTSNSKQSNQLSANTKSAPPKSEEPIIDLLGEDIEFTPYIQAAQDDDFGQFQEAVVAPTLPVQAASWPTTPPSSSLVFDPFADSSDLFQQQTPANPAMFSQALDVNSAKVLLPEKQTPVTEKQNTWSSLEGKIDISLNNLIPHNRGTSQKASLTLNQMTSSASTDFSIFSSKK